MGIRRIACLFDADGFMVEFEPLRQQLESNDFAGLRDSAHDFSRIGMVLWDLLEDLGYSREDIGNEENEFDNISSRLRFWILLIASSHCREPGCPKPNARAIRKLLESIDVDKETTMKFIWGRPFAHLLMHGATALKRSALDRDDPAWPAWCRSYGSLGWLSLAELPSLLDFLQQRSIAYSSLAIVKDYESMIRLLEIAVSGDQGLLLGVSA